MIESIKKVSDGKYIINDCVYISEITQYEENVGCNIGFDPDMTNETEATKIAEMFISEALNEK